jgi:hypothetical protein
MQIVRGLFAQQANPATLTSTPARVANRMVAMVTADGTALTNAAQDSSAAIEQARLFQQTNTSNGLGVTADGTALPGGDNSVSADDSFGTQQVLKTQERVPDWILTGDASLFFTSNVALTRSDTVSDGFGVFNTGLSWVPKIGAEWQLQIGARASLFRYIDTSELDFENIGAGIGVAWAPTDTWGIGFFARYDFTELLDRHSDEILRDHQWTLGAQKVLVLGRSHALSLGVVGMAGISHPHPSQRQQAGAFMGYHLRLTRNIDTDLLYRFGYFFYDEGGRRDRNQVFSASVTYYLTNWASVAAFFSLGNNRSNHSVFDYNVLTSGGGIGLNIRF